MALGIVWGVVLLCLSAFYAITLRTGEIPAGQLDAWNRELPAFEFASKSDERAISPSTANREAVPVAETPTAAEPTEAVEINDFWDWFSDEDPAAFKHPGIRAWFDLSNTRTNGEPEERLSLLAMMHSEGRLTSETLAAFRQDCRAYIRQFGQDLPKLDAMLGGGPLPWPSSETAAKVRLPILYQGLPPEGHGVRAHALNLAVAAGVLGPNAGGSSLAEFITRIVLLDRRFNVEPELPAFLVSAFDLKPLGELVAQPGIGLFLPESISPSDASAVLERIPEPLLDSIERRRRLIRLQFLNERLRRDNFQDGLMQFRWENPEAGIIGSLEHSSDNSVSFTENFRSYLVQSAHALELRLIYPSRRVEFMQSLVDTQKKFDAALDGGPEAINFLFDDMMSKWQSGQKRPGKLYEYMNWGKDVASLNDYNDQRLMLHAVMIARATQDGSGVQSQRMRDYIEQWKPRVSVTETSAGLQLQVGDSRVLVPTR